MLCSAKRKPRKIFLYFLKRKLFLYFRKRKTRKNFSYILGSNFPSPKNENKPTLKKFLIFHKTKLSYISRVIKTNFLMFLIIKHKNSWFFFLDEPTRVFLFFTFFSVILFFFMDVFILHLSRVFSFSIFLVCFHYSTFPGVFFFDLSRYFIFHRFRVLLCCCTAIATDLRKLFLLSGVFYLTLLPHICHSTASATDLRELFLVSDVFYLTLLPDIWHNLLLSRLP